MDRDKGGIEARCDGVVTVLADVTLTLRPTKPLSLPRIHIRLSVSLSPTFIWIQPTPHLSGWCELQILWERDLREDELLSLISFLASFVCQSLLAFLCCPHSVEILNAKGRIEGTNYFEQNNEFIKFVIARHNNCLDLMLEVAPSLIFLVILSFDVFSFCCCPSFATLCRFCSFLLNVHF